MIFRRAAAGAAALLALLALLAPEGAARGWSAPFRLSGPQSADLRPAVASVSPSGQVAVGYSSFEEDTPATARAWLVTRSSGGRVAPVRELAGAQQVLDLAWSPRGVEALTAQSDPGRTCCTQADLVRLAGGRLSQPMRVSSDLDGASAGRLQVLPGRRWLAALASLGGVWVTQSDTRGRPSGGRRLSGRDAIPWELAQAQAERGRTAVAWLVGGHAREPGPPRVLVAGGSPLRMPHAPRVVLSSRPGHRLDELALAAAGSRFTVAALESRTGGPSYRGEVEVVDLGGATRVLGELDQTASGLGLAGGRSGTQVLAFKTCERGGRCWVRVAYRGRGRRFTALARLAAIDPAAVPASTVTGGGTAVVAWVSGGRVLATLRTPRDRRFTAPRALTRSRLAAGLTLAGGPGSSAVAVWIQGTVSPSVVGAERR